MQPIGEKQVKQLREATERKVQGEPSRGAAEDFKLYARRLVKDLELKGTVRTAVEGMNLSLHWSEESDVLAAECIRTFPTATFPATLLLKGEEAETEKLSGVQRKEVSIGNDPGPSVIAALHHGWGERTWWISSPPTRCCCITRWSVFSRPQRLQRNQVQLGRRRGRSIGKNVRQSVAEASTSRGSTT